MTHRDGLCRFSARSVRRGDAVHRKPCATLPESLDNPPIEIANVARRRASERIRDLYGSLSTLLGIRKTVQ
jgi:hypothetical protein